MKPAQRVISYYGSKYHLARHYPAPLQNVVIEPFCGSAGYSLHHYNKQVQLYDLNPKVVGVWDYVIKADPAEIRALPLLEPDQSVDEMSVHQEAKWLIGWWVNMATSSPCDRLSKWAIKYRAEYPACTWGVARREHIAQTSALIKHWKVACATYHDIPNTNATWFIDPPYQCTAGRRYTFNEMDFSHLAEWCRSREGQVTVCENSNSQAWLPFQPFRECVGANARRLTQEVVWYSEAQEPVQGELF